MKRLLLANFLVLLLSFITLLYLYFVISPFNGPQIIYPVVGIFIVATAFFIASGTTLLLYFPRFWWRKRRTHSEQVHLGKRVFLGSLKHSLLLALLVSSLLTMQLYHQGNMVNWFLLVIIYLLIEIYWNWK